MAYSVSGNGLCSVEAIEKDGVTNFYLKNEATPKVKMDNISSFVLEGYEVKTPSLSYDARTLFFAARSISKTDYDLYKSEFKNGRWGKPEVMPASVNSRYDEYSPSLSSDGSTLYFVRKIVENPGQRHPIESDYMMFSKKDDQDHFSLPETVLVSEGKDYSISILPDNCTIIFSSRRNDENGKKVQKPHLYYTKKVLNKAWLQPVMLNVPEDIDEFEISSPSYNSKDKTIYYVINKHKKGSVIGKMAAPTVNFNNPVCHISGCVTSSETSTPMGDVDVSVFDILTGIFLFNVKTHDDGYYAVAVAGGRDYLLDISAPRHSHNYKRFFISSMISDSIGTHSCMLSSKLDLTFSLYDKLIYKPIKADVYITDMQNRRYNNIKINNMNNNEYSMTLSLGQAYRIHFDKESYDKFEIDLSSNRPIQFNKSQLDIELSPIVKELRVKVIDSESGENVASDVIFANSGLDEEISINSSKDGFVNCSLRADVLYAVSTYSKGYLFSNEEIDMSNVNDGSEHIIALRPIKQGVVVQLSDVNFEYNSAEIKPESFESLKQVVALLEKNNSVRIELSAHTDDSGSDKYNLDLSQRRAQSVLNYLISKGIDASRLIAIGYGKSKPLVPNDSDENRAKNRRVEFVVM